MNFNDLRTYLIAGLDPSREAVVNAPFMQQLDNWVPTFNGLRAVTGLTDTDTDHENTTGIAIAPFGSVETDSSYSSYVTIGEAEAVEYTYNHYLCCASKGMVFFAKPHTTFVADTLGRKLYTPASNIVFWCGVFNEGLGAALGSDVDLNIPVGDLDYAYDQLNKYTCGYIELPGTVYGLHQLDASIIANTSAGVYLLQPSNFERFTFGYTQIATDVSMTPMTFTGQIPMLVTSLGEALILETDGIKNLGFSQFLSGVTVKRITKHSYRNTYYICLNAAYTYAINEIGMYKLMQQVHFKSDGLEEVESTLTTTAATAETAPFDLGIEGLKNIKGVVVKCSSDVQVQIGYRESEDSEEFSYTGLAFPDSRGVINEVVSGYEFTIKLLGSTSSSSWVSNLGVLVTDSVKTNFSRLSRRVS